MISQIGGEKIAELLLQYHAGLVSLHFSTCLVLIQLLTFNFTNRIRIYIWNIVTLFLLLSYRVDVDAKNKDGNSPLHLCAQFGQDKVARVLLNSNANVNIKNNKHYEPIHIAAISGKYFDTIRF